MKPLIERFISLERQAREEMMRDERILIEDKIFRAVGIISHARILSSLEFLDLISTLRLGADLGILPELDRKSFNELLVLTQPAHIQKNQNKTLTARERDTIRAELVRKKLSLN